MSRPWKHPKTGVYYLRRRIPADLEVIIGKSEEKRSLGTKDPVEARRLHIAALAQLELQWENLRASPSPISERDAYEIVKPYEEQIIQLYGANPSEHKVWDPEIGADVFSPEKKPEVDPNKPFQIDFTVDSSRLERRRYEEYCRQLASDELHRSGRRTDAASHERLAVAISHVLQRAALKLKKMSRGDWSEGESTKPLLRGPSPVEPNILLKSLAEGWAREMQPVEKTRYSWFRVVDDFCAFVGHDYANKLANTDFIRWKVALIDRGLSAKTIRDSKLAPIRAILQWGADNGQLKENVAERVNMAVKEKIAEARRGFTDDEARIILTAANKQVGYARWVPWLCAYSGARVAEVCQIRKVDIVRPDGINCFVISADAGSLKNSNSERIIPLHPALIAEGFLEFVDKSDDGPLFPDLNPDRFGNRGGSGTKLISRWVRSLGIDDLRLAPSHSWRHRFKTLGRRHGLEGDLVNALTGHGRKTVADRYGEFPISALLRELEKIPTLLTSGPI